MWQRAFEPLVTAGKGTREAWAALPSMTILHFADLHLDAQFGWAPRHIATSRTSETDTDQLARVGI